MNYIIDTHIFLWLIFNQKKISNQKIKILENPNNNVYITSISFWEISLKYSLGKLDLYGIMPEDLPMTATGMNIPTLNVDEKTMASFYQLKKTTNHNDPFDRIIIWNCICHNYTLISQDDKFHKYKKFGLMTL